MQVGDLTSEAPQPQNDALAGDRLALGGASQNPEQNDHSVTSAGFASASDLLSGLGDRPNASAGGPNADIEDSAYEAHGAAEGFSNPHGVSTAANLTAAELAGQHGGEDINKAEGFSNPHGISTAANLATAELAAQRGEKQSETPGESQEVNADNPAANPEDVHESQRSMPDSLSFDPHTGGESAMANSLAGRDAAASRQQGGDRSLARGSAEQAARQMTSDRGTSRAVKASPTLTASFDRYIDKVKDTRQA